MAIAMAVVMLVREKWWWFETGGATTSRHVTSGASGGGFPRTGKERTTGDRVYDIWRRRAESREG